MSLFSQTVIQVALPVPIRRLFDYLLPISASKTNTLTALIGQRVLVPFGRQTLVGVVQQVTDKSDMPMDKLKPAIELFDDHQTVPDDLVRLLNWAAKYYQHPIGDVYNAALPSLLREAKNITELLEKKLVATDQLPNADSFAKNAKQSLKLRQLLSDGCYLRKELTELGVNSTTIKKFVDQHWAQWQTYKPSDLPVTKDHCLEKLQLNTEQALAVSAINNSEQHKCYLLDGITGSGKTEVYLQNIEHILLKQQQALVLVPEIGLTPQTIARFQQRFSVNVALWHSGMTDKQRFLTWKQARTGEAKIIIATRSGIFLPFKQLGIIILDEEHDASFKQQEGFKYHCRSMALYRAKLLDIPTVLGSATPSLETIYNAQMGKYHHLVLNHRATGAVLPKMSLLDLNLCPVEAGIGKPLLEKIKANLSANKQVMLFINRRGFAPVLMCEECNWLTECHRCSSFLTYHKGYNRLICHHCGCQQPTLHQCGGCGSTRLVPVGVGTEQLHLALQELFPEHPVIRLDRDSTSKKGDFDAILTQINTGQPMIIVGTQMIAKGHHFPNVSLVGVVDVDGALFSSDFRAPEKLAQLIVQVSGRAGRGSVSGEVLLQTKFPEHPVIQDLINNKYTDFANFALQERQELQLPPYSHHIVLRAEANDSQLASQYLAQLAPHLQQFSQIVLLGPTPAPMMKKAGKYRHMLTLQCQSRPYLHKIVDWLIENLDTIQKDNRIRWSIDVDPIDLS